MPVTSETNKMNIHRSGGRLYRRVILLVLAVFACLIACSDAKVKKKKAKRPGAFSSNEEGVFTKQRGRWVSEHKLSLEQKQLANLGYLTGYEAATQKGGVTIHSNKARGGANLVTSGHTSGATLMDMDGKTLHTWTFEPKDEYFFPLRARKQVTGSKYMRRANLQKNGDLIMLFDFVGIGRIDKNSKRKWFNKSRFHHDMWLDPSGDIYALDEVREDKDVLGREEDFLDNGIVILDSEGEVKRRVSFARCFLRDPTKAQMKKVLAKLNNATKNDIFHANSIEIITEDHTAKHPALAKGNALISMRSNSTIIVVDMKKERIALLLQGEWQNQHEASLLPNGNILFFDNRGKGTYSRIFELDPSTGKPAWIYRADPPNSFFSRLQGTVNRLSNGNTLITESAWGRAFEIDGEGEKVWEYISPHRASDDPSLVAVLLDLVRIDPGFPMGWIPNRTE